MQIEISALANTMWCSNCDPDYNDTFVLDREEGDETNCYWKYDFEPSPCGSSSYYRLWRTESPADTWWIIVDLIIDDGIHNKWRKSFEAKPDCSVSGLDVPYYAPASGFICDGSSSVCTVTSL